MPTTTGRNQIEAEMKQPYAEEVNFWQTGRSSPDVWIKRAKTQIENLGGKNEGDASGTDAQGRGAFMLTFSISGDVFKIIWPVLPSQTNKTQAARIQAATMLYHYVKSVCLYAIIVGARSAFFGHLVLADGRMAAQVSSDEIAEAAPKMFLLSAG